MSLCPYFSLFFSYPNCLVASHTRRRSWLRHSATNHQKVAGSIPDGIIGIFHWHNTSGRTMALELTQPLTEMSTRNISWGIKAAGAYGWQPYHLHVPIIFKYGSLNLLEPYGPVQDCNGIALPLPLPFTFKISYTFSERNITNWVRQPFVEEITSKF
jgi:hypothetical protein